MTPSSRADTDQPPWWGVDPGPTKTGWVIWCPRNGVLEKGVDGNEALIHDIFPRLLPDYAPAGVAIEKIESFGMAVGESVFSTCWWCGRFDQFFHERRCLVRPVPRRQVKLHLCAAPRARDANIRQALMDRYGSTREMAIGRKASPGPLYGVTTHIWSALALALVAAETQQDDG